MIFGKGINDLSSSLDSYAVWHSMIRRCYSKLYQEKKPSYVGCHVRNDWLLHSNFREWYLKNFVPSWQLDKDLLGCGKLYSEMSCCFLPNEINTLISDCRTTNGNLPHGIYFKKSNGKYVAQLSTVVNGKRKSGHLHIGTLEHCLEIYTKAKLAKLRLLAEQHKSQLDSRAYDALMSFKT
jgi:hypothetical protein